MRFSAIENRVFSISRRKLFIIISIIILFPMFTYILPTLQSNSYNLNIVIDKSIYTGKLLFITAFIFYPGGYSKAQAVRMPGQEIQLNLSFIIDNTEMQRELSILKDHGLGMYPTVYLSIYAIDEKGNTCISSLSYSTLTHYLVKTKDPNRAIELARKDPMGLLKAGTIVIGKEQVPECKPLNVSLDNIASGYQDTDIMGKHLPETFNRGVPGISSSSCNYWSYWEIVFPELNNSTDPPDTWMHRIKITGLGEDLSNNIKREMWDNYRFFFSRAYYYNKNDCPNPGDALYSLVEKYTLLQPGVYTMNDFVTTISKYVSSDPISFTTQWNMTYNYNQFLGHYNHAPLLRATFSYASMGERPHTIIFYSTITNANQATDSIGITVFGHMVLGVEQYMLNVDGYGISLSPYSSPLGSPWSIGYIFAPLDIYYGFDAAYVFYHVENIMKDGEEYWKVVPLVVFLPYYKFLYDFNNIKVIVDDYVNPINNTTQELNTVFANLYTYWSYNDSEFHLPVRQKIYEDILNPGFYNIQLDTNNITSIYRDDLTWLATFLLNKLIYRVGGAYFQEIGY